MGVLFSFIKVSRLKGGIRHVEPDNSLLQGIQGTLWASPIGIPESGETENEPNKQINDPVSKERRVQT